MLNEELDAQTIDRIRGELGDDFFQKSRYDDIKSLVDDVEGHYQAQKHADYDLTHDQKEEIYAHISNVFGDRKRSMKIEWVPQFKFAIAVMFGTAALVASVPLFNWVGDIERPVTFSPEGSLQPYDPPEIPYLHSYDFETTIEAVEVFDDIAYVPQNDFNPIAYQLLPWERAQMEMGEPVLDLPEFDFEESIVNLVDADVAPIPIKRSAPVFPTEARRSHLEGEVVVEFIVDEEGRVGEAIAVSSSHNIFESSAIEAIRKWEFLPGEKDGKTVNVRMRMPIVYHYRVR